MYSITTQVQYRTNIMLEASSSHMEQGEKKGKQKTMECNKKKMETYNQNNVEEVTMKDLIKT